MNDDERFDADNGPGKTRYRKRPEKSMTTNTLLWIIFLVAATIITSVCLYVVNDNKTYANQKEQNAILKTKRDALRKEKQDLTDDNEYLKSKSGVVRSARENDFVMPGERLIVIQGEKEKNSDKAEKKE